MQQHPSHAGLTLKVLEQAGRLGCRVRASTSTVAVHQIPMDKFDRSDIRAHTPGTHHGRTCQWAAAQCTRKSASTPDLWGGGSLSSWAWNLQCVSVAGLPQTAPWWGTRNWCRWLHAARPLRQWGKGGRVVKDMQVSYTALSTTTIRKHVERVSLSVDRGTLTAGSGCLLLLPLLNMQWLKQRPPTFQHRFA